ncbi:MAG: GntR family transcriptional regulator [Rhodoglobus sp.]
MARMPKYQQLAEVIRERVRSGDLRPGDKLPSETTLAQDHRKSLPTVRQALATLKAEGLIESRQGIGTFVRAETRLQRRSRNRYGAARTRTGLLNGKFRHEITAAGPAPLPPRIADMMGADADQTAIVRKRHLYDDNNLQEIGASYLPLDIAANTYLAEPTVVPKALFKCVEELTGRKYSHATDHWIARPATADEADSFDLPIGTYVLHVVHIARDEQAAVLEVSESIWPADRVALIDDYDIASEAGTAPVKSDI